MMCMYKYSFLCYFIKKLALKIDCFYFDNIDGPVRLATKFELTLDKF